MSSFKDRVMNLTGRFEGQACGETRAVTLAAGMMLVMILLDQMPGPKHQDVAELRRISLQLIAELRDTYPVVN